MKKLVSIVIPTRNRRDLLVMAVDSCLRQTYAQLEVIIVDDGSTDGTEAYARAIRDPRVVYVRQPSSQGSVACINRGFAVAQGEYLTWSSDDDLYDPNAIAVMADLLDTDPDVDFVYTHYAMINTEGKLLYPARVEDPGLLDRDNYVGHCFLYRRKVYLEVGEYHPEPFLAEEYEYWLRVRAKFRMKRIARTLYYHRVHPLSLTVIHGPGKMQDAVACARRPFIALWKHHFYVAERYYFAGARGRAVSHILAALCLNLCHRRSWRLLALLILPQAVVRWIRRTFLFRRK